MKCFLKIHSRGTEIVVGVCDENCLGLKLKQDKFCYVVSEAFFRDRLVTIEEAIEILKKTPNFNAVGDNIITALIKSKIIHPDATINIENIPVALKFLF